MSNPISPKREEEDTPENNARKEKFRQYLEEKGMMEILTKMLVELYESNEKPVGQEETLDYCQKYFSRLDGFDINTINTENAKLSEKLTELQAKLNELNKELNGEGDE